MIAKGIVQPKGKIALHKLRDSFVSASELSTVAEERIIARLKVAGESYAPHNKRGRYLAEPDDLNQYRWLMASHVGYSKRRETRLLRKLKQMAREGKIEIQFLNRRMPRFRAKVDS